MPGRLAPCSQSHAAGGPKLLPRKAACACAPAAAVSMAASCAAAIGDRSARRSRARLSMALAVSAGSVSACGRRRSPRRGNCTACRLGCRPPCTIGRVCWGGRCRPRTARCRECECTGMGRGLRASHRPDRSCSAALMGQCCSPLLRRASGRRRRCRRPMRLSEVGLRARLC